jgi:serine protease Do
MKRWTALLAVLFTGVLLGGLATRSLLQGQPIPPAAIPKEITSYRAVVKRVLPGVVSIESRGRLGPRDGGAMRQGFGSGVIVDAGGVILTNHHVVENADEVTVQLMDGRKLTSKDFKSDPKSDLAIVRVKATERLPFLELGDSDEMEIGDRVLAVGAPFGLVGSVTHGIISGKGRSLKMNQYEDFLQTDAAINPGNSGGPLISLDGKVIGITTAIKSRSGGFQGVGLAIASNLARDIMKKLERDGVVKRGYLGVQIQELDDPAVRERLRLPPGLQGVVVSRTFDDSPAAKAGLKRGDIITAIGRKPIVDGRQLQRVVADLPLGRPVQLNVLRDGKQMALELVIAEQPEELVPSAPPSPERDRDD